MILSVPNLFVLFPTHYGIILRVYALDSGFEPGYDLIDFVVGSRRTREEHEEETIIQV